MEFVIDIEANMLLQDALDYSSMPYRLKPDFKVWCIVVRHVQSGQYKALYGKDLTKDNLKHTLRKATKLIGHNIVQYDLPVLSLYGLLDYEVNYPGNETTGFVFDKPVDIVDTLCWSKLLNADRLGGHSLEAWGKRLGDYKGDFHEFDKFSEEMLAYCVQDTQVNAKIYQAILEEQGSHNWSKAYSMEIKLFDLGLKRELFGFAFDRELAEKNIKELDQMMLEIAAKVNPLLPPKEMNQVDKKFYTLPKIKFKQNGEMSSHLSKFLTKIGAEIDLEKRVILFDGKEFPVTTEEPLRSTTVATIEDIDVVKGYLLSLGWVPTEIKERDITKKADKTLRNKVEMQEAIERYLKQTETSVFKQLRLDFFEVQDIQELRKKLYEKYEDTKPQIKWGKMQAQKPMFLPTTPSLAVGLEKEVCRNLQALGDKAAFVGDVVKYFTYRHRRNAIAGGGVDEDGEPITGFMSYVREDGRIPTPADTLGANTGRYRHKIVCNIPRVSSLYGGPMRSLFGCGKGLYQLGFDFASLEARIQGHYVLPYEGGRELADALLAVKPNDIHSVNSRKLGIPRDQAKSISYASMYGAQPKKIAKMLAIPESEGKKLYDAYWDAVPALKSLKEDIEQEWETFGKKYIKGLDGRLLNTRSKHSLINVLFQSGGAICAKWTTVTYARILEEQGLLGNPFKDTLKDHKVWFMIEVHDECQMAVHPKLMDIKVFDTEESAKASRTDPNGAIGHGSKGNYITNPTQPVQLIAEAISGVGEDLSLNVKLGHEYISGANWGQCH